MRGSTVSTRCEVLLLYNHCIGSSEQQEQAVRSLLEEKRAGLSRSRLEELERAQVEVEAKERKQLEREQRRAARLKADRKSAIEELKKRREEKRVLQERLAQEEVVSKCMEELGYMDSDLQSMSLHKELCSLSHILCMSVCTSHYEVSSIKRFKMH